MEQTEVPGAVLGLAPAALHEGHALAPAPQGSVGILFFSQQEFSWACREESSMSGG